MPLGVVNSIVSQHERGLGQHQEQHRSVDPRCVRAAGRGEGGRSQLHPGHHQPAETGGGPTVSAQEDQT